MLARAISGGYSCFYFYNFIVNFLLKAGICASLNLSIHVLLSETLVAASAILYSQPIFCFKIVEQVSSQLLIHHLKQLLQQLRTQIFSSLLLHVRFFFSHHITRARAVSNGGF